MISCRASKGDAIVSPLLALNKSWYSHKMVLTRKPTEQGSLRGTNSAVKIDATEAKQWPRFLREVFDVDIPLKEMVIPEGSKHIIVVPDIEHTGTVDHLFQKMLRMGIFFSIRGSSLPLQKKTTNLRRGNGFYVVGHDGLSFVDPRFRMSAHSFKRDLPEAHAMFPMEYMILYIFNVWRGVRIDQKTSTIFPESKVNGTWHPMMGTTNHVFTLKHAIDQLPVPESGIRLVKLSQ